MYYKIEKPDFSLINHDRKEFLKKNLIKIYFENNLERFLEREYFSWEKIKFQKKIEILENNLELFYVLKLLRRNNQITPIKTENGYFFRYTNSNFLQELTHKLDLYFGGNFLGRYNISEVDEYKFLQNGNIEEAVSSSKIEGATTSSKRALEIIKKGILPVNDDEKMVINNYNALKFIKKNLDVPLSLDFLLEIQKIITKDIEKNKAYFGKFREDSDEIVVLFENKIVYTPPKREFFLNELEMMIFFANDEKNFIHPFLKACILHFWIGYLHPFGDGNGRTARLIFLWFLLKKGYWGLNYIPVSEMILNSKKQYIYSYIYTEQDDFDFNYFLSYIGNKLELAIEKFNQKIEEEKIKNNFFSYNLDFLDVNERQKRLIIHFIEKPKDYTTFTVHKNYYNISSRTASNDLKKLVDMEILQTKKIGKAIRYFPVSDFLEKIKN